ncbi:hypothetical protein B0T09DRAFT_390646 [Sordaria sp. MPI-SDFR-AT-0083]|nr:hypothetical protein B0T09DRAFT_390646 [Sordaria sp. MPI-SDFR-AT-0083]
MVMFFDGKLYTSPLNEKEIKNAIDIGTGTDDHPNCNVIGTDISLIQPSWVPPNASFEINDASKKWTYQENYFDFIHIRWLTGVINDWDSLYKEAYRCCKPGNSMDNGMKNAGFTNITSEDYCMKQLDLYQSVVPTHDIEGFLVYFMPKYLGWTPKEIANYAVIIRREFREAKIHSNIRWRMVRAQKPLDA